MQGQNPAKDHLIFALLLLLATGVHSQCYNVNALACIDLETALPGQVATANSDANLTKCIVFPKTADDVSTIVQILRNYDVDWNLKSGGRDFSKGVSSTAGILISVRPYMQDTVMVGDYATVGPGAKWNEAMPVVQGQGKCIVGGRAGDGGVGGYVVLGGIPYISAQYGFASDNVVDLEAVLADGNNVNANATSSPDLYFALRRGASNFAIATRSTLLIHPIGRVLAGARLYTSEKTPALASAFTNFVVNGLAQAALIPTVVWSASQNGGYIWSVFFFYDGTPGDAFDEFLAIDAAVDETRMQD